MKAPTAYLDNAATTRLDPAVLDAMLPLFQQSWGNPSSAHHVGRAVAKALSRARRSMAERLGTRPGDLVFTSGATEADNLALRGSLLAAPAPRHLITTAVEHPAVLDMARHLEHEGLCELTVLGVDGEGRIDLAELERSLRPGATRLVSVMAVNNETGVIFPIAEISERVHAAGALLHVDGVQAIGRVPIGLDTHGIDLLALSAHKFHGPKGVGVLALRPGLTLQPMLFGGGQQRGRRPGTENPAGVIGIARALELALDAMPRAATHMGQLRDRLEQGLQSELPELSITGVGTPRAPHLTHVTLPDVEAEPLMVELDRAGIACSVGSACSTGALEPSHVVRAMGLATERLHGALRFSLSRESVDEDVDRVLTVLPAAVRRLRALA